LRQLTIKGVLLITVRFIILQRQVCDIKFWSPRFTIFTYRRHMYKNYNCSIYNFVLWIKEYLRRSFERRTRQSILHRLRDSPSQVDVNCYTFGINKLNLTLNTKNLYLSYVTYCTDDINARLFFTSRDICTN